MREARAIALVAATAFAIAGVATAVTTSGCAKQGLCDGDGKDFGDEHHSAGILVGDTWVSNAIDAQWLDFDRGRAFTLWLPHDLDNRQPLSIVAYISIDEYPVADNNGPLANFAVAAGNLAELKFGPYDGFHPARIYVHNGTCEHYYLRVAATFGPAGDGGASDAASDAASDGDAAPDANDAGAD